MTATDARAAEVTDSGLGRVFGPRSVAVIGASPAAGKAGNALMRSLAGFNGSVYPVHPTAQEVLGHRAYGTIDQLPEIPDLALLVVPAPAVPRLVRECGVAGVAGAVVHAGGFAEAGYEGGTLQRELAAAATETGIRLLGPNTSGFVAPQLGLCASFVSSAATIRTGPLAIVAQSGGVNHALAFGAHSEGLGVRLAVGLGNAVDLSFGDVLDHLGTDADTGVVALAIEGVDDGRALIESIERLVDRVPVVALKVGRNDVADFAKSHTGALTGSWKVARAALAQAGAVVVDDTTELLDAARALVRIRLEPRRRVGVGLITGQAGPGLLLADALVGRGVELPELPVRVQDELKAAMGSLTFRRNPVDTGRPGPGFGRVMSAVASAPEVDMLAVYLLDEPDAIDTVEALRGAGPVVLGTGGPPARVEATCDALDRHDVPVFPTPERAASAVAAIAHDAQSAYRRGRLDSAALTPHAIGDVPAESGDWDEDRVKHLVASLGIAVPPRAVCTSHRDALRAAAALGFPVVAKLVHAKLRHKTDVGAVRTGLRDSEELAEALTQLDGADAPGGCRYMVEAMASPGPELLLGAIRDPVFGPLVVLGDGGVDAELSDDASIRPAPVSQQEASTMLDELAAAKRYRGYRGATPVDETKLAAGISSISVLLASHPEIAEIEINPLRVDASGVPLALDALVVATERN